MNRVRSKKNIILTGYKLVLGLEGGSQNWIWHAALEYADYGDEELSPIVEVDDSTSVTGPRPPDPYNGRKLELDHIGLRFGISYRF